MTRKLLIIVGIILVVVAVPLLQARLRGGPTVQVQAETLEPRTIRSSVLASGRLVHEEQVKLSTEEIGKVTAIYVEEGDVVKKGQLLLQIDDQRYRAAVEQNEAAERVQEIAIERQAASDAESSHTVATAYRICTSASSSTTTASRRRPTISRSPRSISSRARNPCGKSKHSSSRPKTIWPRHAPIRRSTAS